MNIVVETVQATTWGLAPAEADVPNPVWVVFSAIHNVHRIWRWYQKAEIYSNPDNFYQLVSGHALNFVAGDQTILRVAAQCGMIANRILECVERQKELARSYRKWINAITGRYHHHTSQEWISQSVGGFSPSTANWLKAGALSAVDRIKRIAITTFNLLQACFTLSMSLMDAIESFSISPTNTNEAINEFFLNANQSLDHLVENQEELLETLEEHREIVSQFLEGVGSSYQVQEIIDVVNQTLETNKKVQVVKDFGQGVVADFAVRVVYGGAQGLGLQNHLPDNFVPIEDPKWVDSLKNLPSKRSYPISPERIRKRNFTPPNSPVKSS